MRSIIIVVAVLAAAPALAQSRYATTAGTIACYAEHAVDDGLKLAAQGRRDLLAGAGCVSMPAGIEVIPLAASARSQSTIRAMVGTAQAFILKEQIYDRQAGKVVGAFGSIDY